MKIYTSYHRNVSKLKDAGVVPVSISRYFPKYSFFKYDTYLDLAPRGDMLKMDEETYRYHFDKILAKLNAKKVFEDIKKLSKGKDVALLCFEKPGDFCHRQIVAKWLSRNLNIEVVEYGQQKSNQLFLF